MPFVSSTARIAVSYPSGISLTGDIVISGSNSNNVLQWRAPPGIFPARDISIIAVGGGRGYTPMFPGTQDGASGSGGNLRYYNDYEVVPNKFYEIAAGKRGTEFNTNGGASYFKDGDTVVVTSGGLTDSYGIQLASTISGSIGGGNGASGTTQPQASSIDSGGGGAGGYEGNGGAGGGTVADTLGSAGAGGGGAGGTSERAIGTSADIGGGVGLYGIGLSGVGGQSSVTQGSLGSNGTYGGGAGNLITGAAPGGLRIVWGTSARRFPSFNVRQKNNYFPLVYTYAGVGNQTSYSYVVPEDVQSLALIVIGGGGGSDTTYQDATRASGGGGAGGFIWGENINVDPGDVLSILVGRGGSAGVVGNIGGKTGGTSSVTLTDAASRNFSVSGQGGTGANGTSAGSNGAASSTGSNGTFFQSVLSYQPTLGVSGASGYGGNGGAPNGLASSAPPTPSANEGGYAGAAYLFDAGGWTTSPAAINPLFVGATRASGNTNSGYGAGASGAWGNFANGTPGSNGVVVIFPNQLLRPSQSRLDDRAGSGYWLAR